MVLRISNPFNWIQTDAQEPLGSLSVARAMGPWTSLIWMLELGAHLGFFRFGINWRSLKWL